MKDGEIRKRLTKLKQTKEYAWLNQFSNNITKQAIKDATNAYKHFFEGRTKFPKFKTKKRTRPSFYQDTSKIKVTDTHVKLEKLTPSKKKNKQKFNWIRLAERGRISYGKHVKYVNPRIVFDGLHWFLTHISRPLDKNREDFFIFMSNESLKHKESKGVSTS